jgi:hypothetical protein
VTDSLKFAVLIAMVFVTVMLFKSLRRKKETKAEEAESYDWTLDDLGPGGVISILGTDYLVEQRSLYAAGDAEWHEVKLVGDAGESWYLTWESDDDDELSLTQEVDFHTLGVAPKDLEALADEGVGEIEYDSETYHLDEAAEAEYFEGGADEGRTMYYWDFLDEHGVKSVGIVLWESRSYDAYTGSTIPASQVDILRPNDEDEDDD